MPAGKRQQSNTMLYTLVAFVGLFIIATVAAVICYVKFEEGRTAVQKAQSDLQEVVSPAEQQKGLGKIVGAKQSRETYLSKMVEYLDDVAYLVIGGIPEDTSAEEKIKEVNRKVAETLKLITSRYPDVKNVDPNRAGLLRTLEKLKAKADNLEDAEIAAEKQLAELHDHFDDARKIWRRTKQILLAEKEKYELQVKNIKQSYAELQTLIQQTTSQQVQSLVDRLDTERTNNDLLTKKIQKVRAEFNRADARMKLALAEVEKIKPLPSIDVTAFNTDGKIILIDNRTKIAHINIGSDNNVYPGLTFAVYDKSLPIPKDGVGKGEIEVFNVGKNISTARILKSKINNPIILEDKIANLIWDGDKINIFVIAGDFDLNRDGKTDDNAVDKINILVENWGAIVSDDLTIETNFLILGKPPKVHSRPTLEEMEIYPLAMEQYKASQEKLNHYKEVKARAQALSVPVFRYETFLYLIGYKTQSTTAGAY